MIFPCREFFSPFSLFSRVCGHPDFLSPLRLLFSFPLPLLLLFPFLLLFLFPLPLPFIPISSTIFIPTSSTVIIPISSTIFIPISSTFYPHYVYYFHSHFFYCFYSHFVYSNYEGKTSQADKMGIHVDELGINHKGICCGLPFELCRLVHAIQMSTLNICLFVCVEVLLTSQPNGIMSSAVSLPNHMFTGQA